MSFRYIITDVIDGCLRGTNDEDVALSCAESEDFFVFDRQADVWISTGVDGLERMKIEEFKS